MVGTLPGPVAAPEMLTCAHVHLLASHGAVEGMSLWQVRGEEPLENTALFYSRKATWAPETERG